MGGTPGTRLAPVATLTSNPLQFLGGIAHTMVGLGGEFVNAVAHPLAQFGQTLANLPMQAVHEAATAAQEGKALILGDQSKYNQLATKEGGYQKGSYLYKEYGSHSLGDLSGLGHALEFGATAATIAAGVPGLSEIEAAQATNPLANRIVQSANDFLGAGKGNVVSKTVRNAILTQPTIQFAGKTADDVTHGKLADSAIDAAMWGLPVVGKYVAPVIKAAAGAVGDATFGKSAILEQMFGHDVTQAYMKNNPDMVQTMKQFEGFTLQQKHVMGDMNLAAPWAERYINERIPGIAYDIGGLDKLMKNMKPYADEMTTLQGKQATGEKITLPSGKQVSTKGLTVSGNFMDAAPKAVKAIQGAINDPRWLEDGQFKVNAVHKAVASLGITNETVNAHLVDSLMHSANPSEAEANLTQMIGEHQKQIVHDLGNGFVYTSAPDYVAHVPTAAEVADKSIATHVPATGAAGAIGKGITAAGLSPRSVDDTRITQSLEDNLNQQLQDHGYIKTSADQLLKMLQTKANMSAGVSDLRMLTAKMIREATNGSEELRNASPHEIGGMLRSAYRSIPAELVGMGPKLTNAVMNPLLSRYLRVQGLGRFELNPFFIFGKVPLKGAVVAGAHGATMEGLAKAFTGQLGDVHDLLKNDVGGQWYTGRTAGDVQDVAGANTTRSTANATQVNGALQRQIDAMVHDVAKAHGTTPEAILTEKGDLYNELQHGAGLIKGYGTGGYLNSPLAKSLNLLIFPSRFETKVAMAATKIMGRMTLVQQTAAISAIGNLAGFMNSDQGKQWAVQNADAIAALKYFSPLSTLQGVADFFTKGQHIQDLGEIGGLPFGVVTQIITNQVPTLGHFGGSQAYDAQGQPYAHAVPITMTARAQTAFKDLLSSMFSYPGQTLGLTSKTKVVQAIGGPATTPAKDAVQYTYANGSLEGSPNAPKPQAVPGGAAMPSPAPSAAPLPTPAGTIEPQTPDTQHLGQVDTSGHITPPKAKKAKTTVPLSAQLPGAAAIAAGL